MVAPLVGAAAIGAAGSLIGGITGGKGAKKAAKIQQQTAREQIAALERNRDYISNLSQPMIDRGNSAGSLIGGFLGLEGGDQSTKALETYRGSTGYQDLLDTGLGAVNANAYARGMGDSGATLKALQQKGMALADQSAGSWLSGLNSLYQTGNAAIGNIAGVATQTTNGINAANQNAANASSNASLAGSAAWQSALQNLVNTGSSFIGAGGLGGNRASSYSAPASYSTPGAGYTPWPGYGLYQGAA